MCFQRDVFRHFLSKEELEQEKKVAKVPPPCFPSGSSGTCSRPSVCQLLAERKLEEIAQRAAKEERFRKAVAARDAAAAAYDVAQKQTLEEPVLGSRRTQQPIAKVSVRTPDALPGCFPLSRGRL